MTFVFKNEEPGIEKGTKLFLQDGLYYYKTITEEDQWLTIEEVENNKERFEKL